MADKRVAQIAGHLFPQGMLAGQVAIITGSGQGIGAETARLFALEGAKVVVQDIDSSTPPPLPPFLPSMSFHNSCDFNRKANLGERNRFAVRQKKPMMWRRASMKRAERLWRWWEICWTQSISKTWLRERPNLARAGLISLLIMQGSPGMELYTRFEILAPVSLSFGFVFI